MHLCNRSITLDSTVGLPILKDCRCENLGMIRRDLNKVDNTVSALLITAPIADQTGDQGVLTVGNINVAAGNSMNRVILDATDTHSGSTTVTGYSNLQIGNGDTNGTLSNTSGINLSNTNSSLSFDRTDAGLSISTGISGSGSVLQFGTGTTTLSGSNTYSGGTAIKAGMLALGANGTTGSGGVTLGAATLAGLGTVSGLLSATGASVSSNITAASTSTIGNLTLGGGVTSANGLTLNFGIDGAGATNSTITLGAGLTVTGVMTVNLYDLGTNSLQGSTPYILVQGTGAISDNSLAVNLLNSAYTLNSAYGSDGIEINGDTMTFEVAGVPEPSVFEALAFGFGILMIMRRPLGSLRS